MNYKEEAQQFLNKEKEFHLGDLITEKPHPDTINLSSIIQKDIISGVQTLLGVDRDIIPVAEKALASKEFSMMLQSLISCVRSGRTICFSSCGASGRLSIILEAMWRDLCSRLAVEHPVQENYFNKIGDQVYSIMTGGDRALIRSVENYEDYQVFGRRQFRDSGLGKGDMMIALTEGGEISSVIGTIKEALERGSKVCMIYNNPTELLINKFQRSREVLSNPDIIKLELTTGPMALSGSTRMQATTVAMLIAGAAVEECFKEIIEDAGINGFSIGGVSGRREKSGYINIFEELLDELSSDKSAGTISELIGLEAECYLQGGLVTYIAGNYLLDIFCDTTERAPTFMIPPFRQYDDESSPRPWAFAKDPLRESREAWDNLLKREPRGLDWLEDDYDKMGVPEDMKKRSGTLDREQILKFHIGNEDDQSRYAGVQSLLLSVFLNEEKGADFRAWEEMYSGKFSKHINLAIGEIDPGASENTIRLPLNIRPTMTRLFEHIAIKLIFNTLSTGTMAKIGRIQGNWMIQLDATNKKLVDRATRIIANFSGLSYEDACMELFKTIHEPQTDRLKFENSYIIQTLERLGVERLIY